MSARREKAAERRAAQRKAKAIALRPPVCVDPDCDTVLSRYNPNPWCLPHNPLFRRTA